MIRRNGILGLGALLVAASTGCNKGGPAETEKKPVQAAEAPQPAAKPAPAPAAAPSIAADAKVVTVNGTTLLGADLDRAMQQQAAMSGIPPGQLPPALRGMLEPAAIKHMIERELLSQEAAKRKKVPSAEKLAAEKKKITGQLPPGKTFAEVLAMMNTDEATFDRDLRTDMGIAMLIEDIREAATKGKNVEKLAREMYKNEPEKFKKPDTAKAHHILLRLPENATAEQEKAIKDKLTALKKALKGKSADAFAAKAREVSEDPSAKINGGDLGNFPRGRMVPAFDAVAFKLKKGQLSELVKTKFGYHLIRGGGMDKGGMQSFDAVKEGLVRFQSDKLAKVELTKLLTALRASAKVEQHYTPKPPAGMPGMMPPGAPGKPPAGHGAPPAPSKANVLPGSKNPHGGAAPGDLKLQLKKRAKGLQLNPETKLKLKGLKLK